MAVELRATFTERLAGWQLKALREAKLATDWDAPNLEYEDAARSFLVYDHGGRRVHR